MIFKSPAVKTLVKITLSLRRILFLDNTTVSLKFEDLVRSNELNVSLLFVYFKIIKKKQKKLMLINLLKIWTLAG